MGAIKIVSKLVISSVVVCALATNYVLADVSLHYSGATDKTLFHIAGDKLRIDMMDGDQRNGGLYYDMKTDQLLITLDAKKQVMDLEKMAGQAAEMKSQMQKMLEAQIQGMSDAEKAQLKGAMGSALSNLMGEKGEPKEPPKTQFKFTGDNKTVGNYSCELVEMTLGNGDQNTVCVAKAKSLGIDAADEAVLNGMMKKMSALSDKMSAITGNNSFGFVGNFKEVLVKSYAQDQLELMAIMPLSVDSESMTVPADYEMTDIPLL